MEPGCFKPTAVGAEAYEMTVNFHHPHGAVAYNERAWVTERRQTSTEVSRTAHAVAQLFSQKRDPDVVNENRHATDS